MNSKERSEGCEKVVGSVHWRLQLAEGFLELGNWKTGSGLWGA